MVTAPAHRLCPIAGAHQVYHHSVWVTVALEVVVVEEGVAEEGGTLAHHHRLPCTWAPLCEVHPEDLKDPLLRVDPILLRF